MQKESPKSFYELQLERHLEQVTILQKKLNSLSVLRFAVFVMTTVGFYFSFSGNNIILVLSIFSLILFISLVVFHSQTKAKYKLECRLRDINKEELNILSGNFYHRNDGSKYKDPKHFYSLDIDLFGKGSFFQYINRTTLNEGELLLVNHLLSNETNKIEQRQEVIKELSKHTLWRQRFSAISEGFQIEYSAKSIINWLDEYKPFLNRNHYLFAIVFGITSISMFTAASLSLFPLDYVFYFLLIGLAITGSFLKKINNLARHTSKIKDTFRQYSLLLKEIESLKVNSELLQQKKKQIQSKDKKASAIFAEFSKALDALDNRNNILIALFGNGYFLWDIIQSYRVEKWIKNHGSIIEDWFEVVNFFDVYNTLATFTFNHPELTFPEIVLNQTTIFATDLGHPLIPKDKRVESDFEIPRDAFFIITGANMAGKSTFLRTVALHIVMANLGLPVTANQSHYHPIKLITSMRTSDSLDEESSYFFSELSRLKFIVETIKNDAEYFIILDEILKGTNSKDKAIGSKQFVEKLVKLKATGIIATHDLSLTAIEDELKNVKNYYFDAQIIDDELFFDYKLKKGICQNMNASFLLRKMEIV